MFNQTQKNSIDFSSKVITHDCNDKLLNLENSDNYETVQSSHIKRFMERWTADPDFRNQVYTEPCKAIFSYGLKVDPEEIRQLLDINFFEHSEKGNTIPKSLKLWQKFFDKNRTDTAMKFAASINEPRFKAWRERQIARTTRQFKKWLQDALIHAPVCFELSKGCSIQCSFCAVSAPRLSNIFTYNQENAKLWRDVLELIKQILGPAASTGCCYWATDPLDNLDYEKFSNDFHSVLGVFPQTTTAQPLKDPDRTRSLLKLSRQKGCQLNRFSILSLKMLNKVHEEFSAEELAFVKLELQNDEANTIKANAGRARERNQKNGENNNNLPEQGTIACVTGFLFNMVDRSVKLISPCNADDRWPLGYIIYDEGTFSNADDLEILLKKMIGNNMTLTIRPGDLISFPRDIEYKSLPDGFQLSTKFKTFKFHNDLYLRELGQIIHKGDKTAEEIASLFDLYGISPTHTYSTLNLLFDKGVLDDEPKPKVSERLVQK
ncbi:radical SAM family RiPP maturation amino acid epimerase [Nostoc sp. CHAB 5824]|nr:radical SAM family RiPP maturation amino acid epimerase [Nostoc sp. CHAB 5824]